MPSYDEIIQNQFILQPLQSLLLTDFYSVNQIYLVRPPPTNVGGALLFLACPSVHGHSNLVTFHSKNQFVAIRGLCRIGVLQEITVNGSIHVIPIFHTGHKSPESPQIWGGRIREESVLIQIRCRHEYSGGSAQFGWNRARDHYD